MLISLLVYADVYMHYPRGSNDRCDEASNDRNNDNRLFDSQNNAAGGYGICNKEMEYYEDTTMNIQWTSQHACGNGRATKNDPLFPEKNTCQMILQLGCEDAFGMDMGTVQLNDYVLTDGRSPVDYKNADGTGSCTQTKPLPEECTANTSQDQCATLDLTVQKNRDTFNSDACKCSPRKMATYGQHESFRYYDKCRTRNRNMGLYVANNLSPTDTNRMSARFTRQNANGDRHGYECTEERDYYPYFHWTPWRDIAVLTSDTSVCNEIQQNSQNVLGRGECVNQNDPTDKSFWMYNNQKDCETTTQNAPRVNAKWVSAPSWGINAPDCVQAPYLLDNHLGQVVMSKSDDSAVGQGGQLQSYQWRIPKLSTFTSKDDLRCTLRLRYNISTSEVPRTFTSKDNQAVKNKPLINAGDYQNGNAPEDVIPLKITLNTNQNSRTFEDRSYVFKIKKRTSDLENKNIINVNIRGKRGNIAQVRNCVEYDFVPGEVNVNRGDLVHFQWCGSDYNDKNNAGQGLAGTDRSNLVPLGNIQGNLIAPVANVNLMSQEDLKALAWINQTNCYSVAKMADMNANVDDNNVQQDPMSCQYLNGASGPYFSHMAEIKDVGSQCFASTRNNNFSNRSQKMCMTSSESVANQTAMTAGIIGGVVGFIIIVIVVIIVIRKKYGGGFVLLQKYNPYPRQI
eukprot:NODE_36_length_36011_cov_1.012920.p3 type:complete len:681 gc:universal NODE_36_length_36011_cov_1.012920:17678-15636(-)